VITLGILTECRNRASPLYIDAGMASSGRACGSCPPFRENGSPAHLSAAASRRHRVPGAGNIFGFILAGLGGFSLIDDEQGWVFAMLALASVIMLASGIFASWLLVLQIGVPSAEKRTETRSN
jgi:hypothetical protein